MSEGLKKLKKLIGIEEEYIEEEDCYEDEVPEEETQMLYAKSRKAPVVALHVAKQMKVIVIATHVFDDVQPVADHLKNRRPVIINLQDTEKEVAKRIVDFLSGTVYALEGNMKRVADYIFLFTPDNVDISQQDVGNAAVQDRHKFPWDK